MDDRGKYIYISLEEMRAVSDYIKRKGRVSISHLASKSNQFIDLEPKALTEEIPSVDEIVAAWINFYLLHFEEDQNQLWLVEAVYNLKQDRFSQLR